MDTRSFLVVDDDEGFKDNLKDILEAHGYEVLCAGSCSEAKKITREQRPMVALVDIRLPDGSGTALLGDLKELNRECICAMMTAFADLESALRALEWGAFQYLQKPVRPQELLNLLKRAFDTIDLKEQKRQAENRLRDSERTVRSLLDAFPSAAFLIDTKGAILAANKVVADALGVDVSALQGIHVDRLGSTEKREARRSRAREVVDSKETLRFEEKVGDKYLDTIIAPILDNERNVSRLAVFSRDITEMKHAEEEKKRLQEQLAHSQKMEAIGTLAGGIAHDFNNLLQAIMGYTEILLTEKETGDPDSGTLREIERAAQRASELTRGLLMFSRKIESKRRPIDLNQQVIQVERLLRRTIPRMIEIELRLAGSLKIAHADPSQMEQILMNLGVNARDAMPGGGKLVIETRNVTWDETFCQDNLDCVPGEYLLMKVTDTGHGMDAETMEHIFEPFFTTKDIGKGTGLGLATVYGIVKGHKGHIFCESQPGRGTTFEIYLPVTKAGAGKDFGQEDGEKPSRGTETILVVEDEETLRDLARHMLRRYGYKVILAADGESALDLYEKNRADISLVVLDLIMPGMGGKRCLEELLRRDPALKVVIASGYFGDDPEGSFLEAGAKGVVNKPYDIRNVLQVIRQVLDEGH
ncbi:MAG: response regulator [Desulfobacterales bacterium]|nr:MAG: response regulator [Desulfobacterales bacterium]